MRLDIGVRHANAFEGILMASMHAACFARAWDKAAMAHLAASPDTICLIASVAGDSGSMPGGLLIARKAADEAELLTLCVLPACRRMGVARALLHEAISALRSNGALRLFLEVEDGNQAARRLYHSFGAIPVGKREGYYEHGADAAIFSLAL